MAARSLMSCGEWTLREKPLDLRRGLAHRGAMRRPAGWWVSVALLTAGLWASRSDARLEGGAGRQIGRMSALPRVTVWAWERREDLRAVDAATTAVAYLDQTLLVD